MSKEELKRIKKKAVFWFWVNNFFLTMAYFFISKDVASIAVLFYPFILISVSMMFVRLSQWFIEREN